MNTSDIISVAQVAISSQRSSLDLLGLEIGQSFVDAVRVIAAAPKVVTSGIGKSGIIARKMAATLNSINLPSVFLHPVEAAHGDSGLLQPMDVVVLFSKSGETPELVRFCAQARAFGCTTVCIVTRRRSVIADQCDHVLLAPIERELDKHNILPTASTTNALIVADLLAVSVSHLRGNTSEDLRRSHPEGMIGAGLRGTVADAMHNGDELPIVFRHTSMSECLVQLTSKGLGCVCVCDENRVLVGFITDGDIRRAVQRTTEVVSMRIEEIMTRSPRTITSQATLHDALILMEQPDGQVGVLPVVDNGVCVGVLRLHDIAKRQV